MMVSEQELRSVKLRYGIIGNAEALNTALRVAVQVAPTEMTVLITGESGSGKESFSKAIHALSRRKHGTFIAINCGAIPEGTIDSELFGHEKGSFTGAHEARKGYFEVTDGGTLFLDEVGEMPQSTQARLLRVLENGEFIRVGASKAQKTDVRVVAATNVDLREAVQKGKFREDLYYRLSTVPIHVPPLRERGKDIELLFRKFAGDFAEQYRMDPLQLSPEAETLLLSYRFPGNIRQLKNLVEQMSALETERLLSREKLAKYLPDDPMRFPALVKQGPESVSERELLYQVLFDMKRDMAELKKLVFEGLQNESYGAEILSDHKELFVDMDEDMRRPLRKLNEERDTPLLLESSQRARYEAEEEDTEDTEAVVQQESLSLEDQERDLILKALKRHNNRRKLAADELGISERTLYRKLKQYELDS